MNDELRTMNIVYFARQNEWKIHRSSFIIHH